MQNLNKNTSFNHVSCPPLYGISKFIIFPAPHAWAFYFNQAVYLALWFLKCLAHIPEIGAFHDVNFPFCSPSMRKRDLCVLAGTDIYTRFQIHKEDNM